MIPEPSREPPERPICPDCGEYVDEQGDCPEPECDGHRMTPEEERDAHGDALYEEQREEELENG